MWGFVSATLVNILRAEVGVKGLHSAVIMPRFLGRAFFNASSSRIMCYLHDEQRGDILTDMV